VKEGGLSKAREGLYLARGKKQGGGVLRKKAKSRCACRPKTEGTKGWLGEDEKLRLAGPPSGKKGQGHIDTKTAGERGTKKIRKHRKKKKSRKKKRLTDEGLAGKREKDIGKVWI